MSSDYSFNLSREGERTHKYIQYLFRPVRSLPASDKSVGKNQPLSNIRETSPPPTGKKTGRKGTKDASSAVPYSFNTRAASNRRWGGGRNRNKSPASSGRGRLSFRYPGTHCRDTIATNHVRTRRNLADISF